MMDEKVPEVRDEAWVRERFGDVGPPPDDEVHPDEAAEPAPNIEHPK
jgi:hypothetical protein